MLPTKILVFVEGTILMHGGAAGHSRKEIVQQVKRRESTVKDYARYMPISGAVKKIQKWIEQGVEVVYLTSRRGPEEVGSIKGVLGRYGFPEGHVEYRRKGEEYKDVVARVKPRIFIEDDCESIGGEMEITSSHLKPELKQKITCIVVKEFEGIDKLSEDIALLRGGMSTQKMRFAFIDAQNTETTTRQLLGFMVDWKRLYDFLKKSWGCLKVFLYSGVDAGDSALEKEFEELRKTGCVVRSKVVFAYKNKNKDVQVKCPKCQSDFMHVVDMGYNKKSNCDVDLTVDAMECAGLDTELYLFTGDGDFEYLVRKAVEKGSIVHIISSARKVRSGPKYFTSRFSSRLRKLTEEIGKPVDFMNIDNLKLKIQKEIK